MDIVYKIIFNNCSRSLLFYGLGFFFIFYILADKVSYIRRNLF